MNSSEVDFAQSLNKIADGQSSEAERLMPLVYDQMRALAASMLNQEVPGHTLQPTALVNEAYLKLADQNRVTWKGKTHFFAIGAKAMRRILVDHARGRNRQKRGGGMRRIALGDDMKVSTRTTRMSWRSRAIERCYEETVSCQLSLAAQQRWEQGNVRTTDTRKASISQVRRRGPCAALAPPIRRIGHRWARGSQ